MTTAPARPAHGGPAAADPDLAARCAELRRGKLAAGQVLEEAYHVHGRYREARDAVLPQVVQAKDRLNRARSRARPEEELAALAARVVELEAPGAALLAEHEEAHRRAVERFLEVDAAQTELVHDAARRAHAALRAGREAAAGELLRAAGELVRTFLADDDELLARVIERRPGGGRRGRGAEEDVTLARTLSRRCPENKAMKDAIERRRRVLAAEAFFGRLAARAPARPGLGEVPAAVQLEPGVGPEAQHFRDQVVDRGLLQVFVAAWGTRVIVPLDLEEALGSAGGRAFYMTPGSGSVTSNALSSVIAAMDVCRMDGRWLLAPFLVDAPHHSYGPFDAALHDLAAVLAWMLGHLRQLRRETGLPPAYAGRSTGGLLGLELARRHPAELSSVVALSPPSPSAVWQDHMSGFYDSAGLDAPDLWGYGWFNGGAALGALRAAAGSPELEALRDAPSVRLQCRALSSPLSDAELAAGLPPVLILYGMDDTAQYPDARELFPEPRFPDLPLNEVWLEAQRRYPHVTTFPIPGGHFQFPIDNPCVRRLSRDLVHAFLIDPASLAPGGAARADVEQRLGVLRRLREAKLELWAEGYRGEDLCDEGAIRLEERGDAEALALWDAPEFHAFLATEPGRIY